MARSTLGASREQRKRIPVGLDQTMESAEYLDGDQDKSPALELAPPEIVQATHLQGAMAHFTRRESPAQWQNYTANGH